MFKRRHKHIEPKVATAITPVGCIDGEPTVAFGIGFRD